MTSPADPAEARTVDQHELSIRANSSSSVFPSPEAIHALQQTEKEQGETRMDGSKVTCDDEATAAQGSETKGATAPLTSDHEPDDGFEDYDLYASDGCQRCGGEGFIVVCIDDMCRGAGECMHGDGEIACPDCGGI